MKNKKSNVRSSPIDVKKALQKAHHHMVDIDDVTPIIQFIEDFKKLADPRAQLPCKLISIKMPVPLLAAFKFKAEYEGVRYQTMIKKLMVEWLKKPSPPPSSKK